MIPPPLVMPGGIVGVGRDRYSKWVGATSMPGRLKMAQGELTDIKEFVLSNSSFGPAEIDQMARAIAVSIASMQSWT
jgi:hypothetical protein